MDFTQLKVTKELPIAIIKLNRPEAMNALNSKMVSELVDALTELEKDDEVRCLIITGDDRTLSQADNCRIKRIRAWGWTGTCYELRYIDCCRGDKARPA